MSNAEEVAAWMLAEIERREPNGLYQVSFGVQF
jgi:hypothetical protein